MKSENLWTFGPLRNDFKIFLTFEKVREIQKSLSKEALDVWTPQKEIKKKKEALWTSGRLDPSKKTSYFFEHLKKCGKFKKSLSRVSLDVWTPQKDMTIFSKF